MQCRYIITERLQSVQQIIEVLYFGNGAQSAHGKTNSLSHDGKFANTRIKNPFFTVLRLQTGKSLVHIANVAKVFSKCNQFWIGSEQLVEIIVEDFKAINSWRIVRIHRFYFINAQCRFWTLIVKVRIV